MAMLGKKWTSKLCTVIACSEFVISVIASRWTEADLAEFRLSINMYPFHFNAIIQKKKKTIERIMNWVCKINRTLDDHPYQVYTHIYIYTCKTRCAHTLCDKCDCIMMIFWKAIAFQLGYIAWFALVGLTLSVLNAFIECKIQYSAYVIWFDSVVYHHSQNVLTV